jgi:hypothetical protein
VSLEKNRHNIYVSPNVIFGLYYFATQFIILDDATHIGFLEDLTLFMFKRFLCMNIVESFSSKG